MFQSSVFVLVVERHPDESESGRLEVEQGSGGMQDNIRHGARGVAGLCRCDVTVPRQTRRLPTAVAAGMISVKP